MRSSIIIKNIRAILVKNEQPSWNIRQKTASLYELRLKFGPLKCLHYLFYPNRVYFFITRYTYHFYPCSDYLAEGPSTGKNFGSARMKFGTDRLFTLQILSEPNLFFLGPVPISPEPCQKKKNL